MSCHGNTPNGKSLEGGLVWISGFLVHKIVVIIDELIATFQKIMSQS
jgi:hypothetical protein